MRDNNTNPRLNSIELSMITGFAWILLSWRFQNVLISYFWQEILICYNLSPYDDTYPCTFNYSNFLAVSFRSSAVNMYFNYFEHHQLYIIYSCNELSSYTILLALINYSCKFFSSFTHWISFAYFESLIWHRNFLLIFSDNIITFLW